MRLEHNLVGGYVRYISPHIIILLLSILTSSSVSLSRSCRFPLASSVISARAVLNFSFSICVSSRRALSSSEEMFSISLDDSTALASDIVRSLVCVEITFV